jgi:hypothetical protein
LTSRLLRAFAATARWSLSASRFQQFTFPIRWRVEDDAMTNSGYGYGVGMVFSILAIAAGAVMYWAVTAPAHGFRVSTVGVVLMVVGAAGLLISTVLYATARRNLNRSSYHQQTIDSQGRETVVHQEVR